MVRTRRGIMALAACAVGATGAAAQTNPNPVSLAAADIMSAQFAVGQDSSGSPPLVALSRETSDLYAQQLVPQSMMASALAPLAGLTARYAFQASRPNVIIEDNGTNQTAAAPVIAESSVGTTTLSIAEPAGAGAPGTPYLAVSIDYVGGTENGYPYEALGMGLAGNYQPIPALGPIRVSGTLMGTSTVNVTGATTKTDVVLFKSPTLTITANATSQVHDLLCPSPSTCTNVVSGGGLVALDIVLVNAPVDGKKVSGEIRVGEQSIHTILDGDEVADAASR